MAKQQKDASDVKLVRRNKTSGEIGPRKRGRPSPEYENGWVNAAGDFKVGNPPKRRGRKGRGGRPKGSKNKNVNGAVKRAGGLNEIEQIVKREVESRLKAAKEAALKAFNHALGV